MNDQTLRYKLREFVALGNALDQEAKRRYGPEGLLFHEADGTVCIMDSYPEDGDKVSHIKFSGEIVARWGSGAF